jgi:hypothetical protein
VLHIDIGESMQSRRAAIRYTLACHLVGVVLVAGCSEPVSQPEPAAAPSAPAGSAPATPTGPPPDIAVLRKACVDAIRWAQGTTGRAVSTGPSHPSRADCRGGWRWSPDGRPPIDYDLSIDLRMQRAPARTPTTRAADRCDTDGIRLDSGPTFCVQRPTRDRADWYGVFGFRGVDVELRLTATNLGSSDLVAFEQAVLSVIEAAANVLADTIVGR